MLCRHHLSVPFCRDPPTQFFPTKPCPWGNFHFAVVDLLSQNVGKVAYSHWSGIKLPGSAARFLAHRPRFPIAPRRGDTYPCTSSHPSAKLATNNGLCKSNPRVSIRVADTALPSRRQTLLTVVSSLLRIAYGALAKFLCLACWYLHKPGA